MLWNTEESGHSIWNERYMHPLLSARIYPDRQKTKNRATKEEDGTILYGSRPVADADIF